MKPSLDKCRASTSQPGPSTVSDYSFYEYHWDGPKRLHVPIWQPRQTTLVVVLEGESRRLFSTARILVYFIARSQKDARSSDAWAIQQSGSVIHSFRGQVQNPLPNPSALPKLTVAFEVVVDPATCNSFFGNLVLRSPADTQEARRDIMRVLLEHECPLTCDTLSLSLSFTHSTMLWTPITLGPDKQCMLLPNPTFRIEYITTRIVRVIPPPFVRRKFTNGSLPTELLIKIFEDAEFRDTWHDDLLSFAQVCRTWSCAMNILHARLSFSEDDRWNSSRHLLDVYALADALNKRPLLGRSFYHFTTNNFGTLEDLQDIWILPRDKNTARFTTAVITILRATKNLQCLHLGQLDPSQAGALFSVLHALRDLQTFSMGPLEEGPIVGVARHNRMEGTTRTLSIAQLARCMGRWRGLKILRLHHLHPGIFGIWRFALRPPACKLTQLTISQSHVADKDLTHLFSSSAKTLERVVLDRIEGVTNAGLSTFLLAISHNVTHLTVQDVAPPPYQQWGNLLVGRAERAMDVVIDKMSRLQELKIGGDVASEFMLDRRSKMFVASGVSEETRVPVVLLWLEDVPRLGGFVANGKWPGWCTPDKAPRY